MPRKASASRPTACSRITASMRPGLLCPGKLAGAHPQHREQARFNEAGAVMPRKGPRRYSAPSPQRCFNEAGAVMPRKVGRYIESLIAAGRLQ